MVLAGLLLSACQAPDLSFGPIGGETKRSFGYSETEQAPGAYILKVVHPQVAVMDDYWNRRASELCEGRPYKKTIFEAAHPTQLYDRRGGRPSGVLRLEGFLECAPAEAPEGVPATEEIAPPMDTPDLPYISEAG